jgi:hypothetical protein
MRKLVVFAIVLVFLAVPLTAFGTMGQMSPKSKDINVEFFGRLKTYPTWQSNMNFNSDKDSETFDPPPYGTDPITINDGLFDENGYMADHNIRNELRMGWKGGNDTFDFLIILEADFNLDKNDTDRAPNTAGSDFGIEKLDVGYNFGPFRLHTGWADGEHLDMFTGGLVYGNDHPYIGLNGNIGENFSWRLNYVTVFDQTTDSGGVNPWDGDDLDWRFYTAKGIYTIPSGFAKGFVISPFYAFSDNTVHNNAQVNYIGLEGYGKLGIFTPRFEIVYADGDTDKDATGTDYDISAMAAYASVDVEICPGFIPYVGVRYMEGDDDPDDDDYDAYNSIGDIMRYTPTFGMENGIVYRRLTVLGTQLYAGNFNGIGNQTGYGGDGNNEMGDAPGLIMWGLGVKGTFGKWSYKAQYMDFSFDEEPDHIVAGIDDEVGQEFDLRVAYAFSKHFTIANCFAAFEPGDAIEDLWGNDYDDTALINTIELIWNW